AFGQEKHQGFVRALRLARELHLPPCSRVLRLPFEAWCDTDLELFLALDQFDASLCSCGQPRAVCRDDSHRWQVVADVCGPSAALARFHADHKDDLPDGLMLGVRLLAPGETPTDPLRALLEDDLA